MLPKYSTRQASVPLEDSRSTLQHRFPDRMGTARAKSMEPDASPRRKIQSESFFQLRRGLS
jgi:hypothetical protein